jgi:hypothetical protein
VYDFPDHADPWSILEAVNKDELAGFEYTIQVHRSTLALLSYRPLPRTAQTHGILLSLAISFGDQFNSVPCFELPLWSVTAPHGNCKCRKCGDPWGTVRDSVHCGPGIGDVLRRVA